MAAFSDFSTSCSSLINRIGLTNKDQGVLTVEVSDNAGEERHFEYPRLRRDRRYIVQLLRRTIY